MFMDAMGGGKGDDKSVDDMLLDMFTRAFEAMMGVDKYKERLEQRERELQEALERERQARLTAEQKLEAVNGGNAQDGLTKLEAEPVAKDKVVYEDASVQTIDVPESGKQAQSVSYETVQAPNTQAQAPQLDAFKMAMLRGQGRA